MRDIHLYDTVTVRKVPRTIGKLPAPRLDQKRIQLGLSGANCKSSIRFSFAFILAT